MNKNGTATLEQFAELNSLVTRALPKAIEGIEIKETLGLANANGERLSSLLHTALIALGEQAPANPPPTTTPEIPTSFTVGGRHYDLVSFVKDDENSVSGPTMVARATELEAELGEEDARFILEHQNEIPAALRGRIAMVFTKWRDPDGTRYVADPYWHGNTWFQFWSWLDYHWNGSDRLVRRRIV